MSPNEKEKKEMETIPMAPTAPPREPGKGPRKPGKLWRWLFTVVLFPFLLLGVPTHLLCWKSGDPRSTSLKGWFRSIFIPFRPQSVILTVIFLCTTAFGTYAVFRWLIIIVWALVIKGEVNLEILDALYNLVQALPLYLPTMAIWLFGASIKSVLWGYDVSQFELETLVASCYDIGDPESRSPKYYSSKSLLQRVLFVYAVIAIIISVTMAEDFYGFNLPEAAHFYRQHDYWYGIWILLSYNFVLALYTMICWGLQCQLQLFSHYLNALKSEELKPSLKILGEVKLYFKKLADQISIINKGFSMLLSYVIILLIGFAILNTISVVLFAMPSFITIVLKIIDKYLNNYGIDIDISLPWAHYTNKTAEAEVDEYGTVKPILEKYGPVFVRTTVAYIFLVITQLSLIFFVGQQAVTVNTMLRYFSVQFNDYMSSAQGNVSVDLYNEFRLVRFYIISSITFQGKWIILRVPIMNYVPVIKNKINRTGVS